MSDETDTTPPARTQSYATGFLVAAALVYIVALYFAAVRMSNEVEAAAHADAASVPGDLAADLLDRPIYIVFGIALPCVLAAISLFLFLRAHLRLRAAESQ